MASASLYSPVPHTVTQPSLSAARQVAPRNSAGTESAFEALVDAVNPLQQIPGVAQAYRALTGDKMSAGAQLAGHVGLGAAVAGPLGAAIGAGVFVLENLVPGVVRAVGHLFGGNPAKSPAQTRHAAVAEPAKSAPAGSISAHQGARGAVPALSSAQFEILMQSLGTAGPAEQRKSASGGSSPIRNGLAAGLAPADFAARMTANLDRLSAAKRPGNQ